MKNTAALRFSMALNKTREAGKYEMTTPRYTHIHDETLKKAFSKFNEKLVDIDGYTHRYNTKNRDVKWLKENITTQALSNGICTLPCSQKKCSYANACLSCASFRTNVEFLPQHKQQLTKTREIIAKAKEDGFERLSEMNQQVEKSLSRIIKTLEAEK